VDESLHRPLPSSRPGDPADFFAPLPVAPPRDRVWLHVWLFVLTVVATSAVGGCHYRGFEQAFEPGPTLQEGEVLGYLVSMFTDPWLYLQGLWYSLTILAILGCHEMGHYVACRYYRVDASLPYFLPAPLPLTGTLGAFIRIRQRIPSKVALFDIGIAGPIAGFVVAVPALLVGLLLSNVVAVPPDLAERGGLYLGEPLLFRGAAWLVLGDIPDGHTINMHPMLFAAWFGLLATALNLFPIGQLDGGHIAYAVLGRRSSVVTLVMIGVAIGLTFVSSSWMVWTVLMVLMLVAIGPHHPPTLNDHMPLARGRLLLALFALLMLIVCFTPAPIEPFVTGQ
jgi:membrane-associated protease RseP (regulator of RpoE activity)